MISVRNQTLGSRLKFKSDSQFLPKSFREFLSENGFVNLRAAFKSSHHIIGIYISSKATNWNGISLVSFKQLLVPFFKRALSFFLERN